MKLDTLCVGAAIACAAVAFTFAGDLDPPTGPVAPTAGPEPRIPITSTNAPGDADSVFRIAQPGSYYLTGNVTGEAGKGGIEIGAHNVSIDLMGYRMLGVAGSLAGIRIPAGIADNITVRNGVITGWAGDGVDLEAGDSTGSIVEQVHVSGNVGMGIRVSNNAVIRGCTAAYNGIDGIRTLNGGVVIACTASNNSSNGMQIGAGATVTGSMAMSNADAGIGVSAGCVVTGCAAFNNSGSGITTNNNSTVAGCATHANDSHGIHTGSGCTVIDCTSGSNAIDGIRVNANCIVRGNTCSANGSGAGDGAGIHVLLGDNRIEVNNCTDADRGIDVDTAGNFIIRNTCAGNTTNWDIVANNVCGPILDRTAPASAAIVGNSAPDSTGSTHPNANFTY